MRDFETFGVAELSTAELQDTTGGEYSVMWLLGWAYQKLADLPPAPPGGAMDRVY
jgi:hypothetical protein